MIAELGYGLATVTWGTAGLLLLARGKPPSSAQPHVWLIATVACELLWACSALLPTETALYRPLSIASDALRPALFTALMLILLRGVQPARLLLLSLGLAGAIALARAASLWLELAGSIQNTLGLIAAVYCILCVEQVYRNALPEQRWLIKFACLCPLLMFAFEGFLRADALLYGRADPSLIAAQGYVDALLAPVLAIGGLRLLPSRLKVRFSRDAAFHTATLLVSGLFLTAMAALGYGLSLFGASWGGVLQWIILFAGATALILLLGSGHVRAQVRVWVSKHFFSHRYDYRREWMRLTGLLAGAEHEAEKDASIASRGLQALVDMVEARGGLLWTQDASGAWVLRARINAAQAPDLRLDDPVPAYLGRSGWIMDIDAWRDGRTPEGAPALAPWLRTDPEAWILMAISVQSAPVALVQLQRPLAPIPIDWEVRDLLNAAGQQVAGLLRTEQALESLVQARQFDSFNRMSAFVVHDLKNLVAQLGLMLRNAQRHRDNPEFQADMLETVANVQERMQSMLLQLRAGTQPIEAAHPIDLDSCLRRAVTDRSWPDPKPELVISAGDPGHPALEGARVLGHSERLERVVGHLIQNGIEASGSEEPVRVVRGLEGDAAVIQVIDSGCGMSQHFLEHELFRPFRSTKAHGMGIGAFESREYIREIGGELRVVSTPDRGSTFTIRLPICREMT